MKSKTRGEAEAEITQAVIRFEKEYLGRGPLEARTYFINDMIFIRLRGVLTAGDHKLAETLISRPDYHFNEPIFISCPLMSRAIFLLITWSTEKGILV